MCPSFLPDNQDDDQDEDEDEDSESMRMRIRVNIRVADETFSIRRIKENSAIATFGENVNEYDVDDDKEADEVVRMIVQQKG